MRYILKDVLGRGAFGVVHRAVHHDTKKEYAIKTIDVTRATNQTRMFLITELRILSTHRCPFLVAFKDAYFETKFLHIVTEFASKGDMAHIIRARSRRGEYISGTDVWHYFLQMCIAVDYLHQINVLHRDIKPANILVTHDNCIKLADVGVSKVMRTAKYTYTQVGTPLYMSPEIYKRERYDRKSDAWSLGCVLFEMMHLRPAFAGNNLVMLRDNILRGPPRLSPRRYDRHLSDIVTSLLSVHLRARPTIREIMAWPVVATQMRQRGLAFAIAENEVKPLFHVPCVVPPNMQGWNRIVELFCDMKNTIQLDENEHKRLEEIKRIRSELMNGPRNVQSEIEQLTYKLQLARAEVVRLEEKISVLKGNLSKTNFTEL